MLRVFLISVLFLSIIELSKSLKEDEASMQLLLERMGRQDSVIEQLTQTVKKQERELTGLRNKMKSQSAGLDHVGRKQARRSSHAAVFTPSAYNASTYGCLYDTLELTCSAPTMINVTVGYYGLYAVSCSGCCAPDLDTDCTEEMEESRYQDWVAIKYACDNKTSCSFQYQGNALASCDPPDIAHYLYVEYECYEEVEPSPEGAVAFTAYTTENINYINGDIIEFDNTLINAGGNYATSNSTFTCTVPGVYFFSFNLNSVNSNYMEASLVKDNERLVAARADANSDSRNFASNFAVVELYEGNKVWVMSEGLVENWSAGERHSTFSGGLLFRYE